MTQPAATPSVSPTKLDEATANQPITRPKEFKGRFTVANTPWKAEYADVKSSDYKMLKSSLEEELNDVLEKAIPGFVLCVVQWFNKGSVITHFAVYVSGNPDLTPDKLHTFLLGALSTGSLANFTLENITVQPEQSRGEEATEETETFLKWELWKIVSLGGLLIVFILLLCILGLMVSSRSLILLPSISEICNSSAWTSFPLAR